MAVPCARARGMNLYGIAAIPWFPSEVLKLATSDVQQPLKKSPIDTNTIAMKPGDDLLTSTQTLRHNAGNLRTTQSQSVRRQAVGVSYHGQR